MTGQLLAEARERKTEGKAAHLAEFAQIKRELLALERDARMSLPELKRHVESLRDAARRGHSASSARPQNSA